MSYSTPKHVYRYTRSGAEYGRAITPPSGVSPYRNPRVYGTPLAADEGWMSPFARGYNRARGYAGRFRGNVFGRMQPYLRYAGPAAVTALGAYGLYADYRNRHNIQARAAQAIRRRRARTRRRPRQNRRIRPRRPNRYRMAALRYRRRR